MQIETSTLCLENATQITKTACSWSY